LFYFFAGSFSTGHSTATAFGFLSRNVSFLQYKNKKNISALKGENWANVKICGFQGTIISLFNFCGFTSSPT